MRNDVLTASDNEHSVVDSVGGNEAAFPDIAEFGKRGKKPGQLRSSYLAPTFPGVNVVKKNYKSDYRTPNRVPPPQNCTMGGSVFGTWESSVPMG